MKKNDPKLTTLRRNHEYSLYGPNDEGIGVDGAKTLAKALESNTALSSLHLDGNQIGDEGAESLAKALKPNTTLSSLYLNGNQIGDEGAKALAQALPHTELATLYLYNNQIGDEGAKALANALKLPSTKLSTLGLSNNQISVEGAKALANALYTNATLSVLYIGMNMFGDKGATSLLIALKDYNTTLERIELNDNGISKWSLREEIHDMLDLDKSGTRQDLELVQANRREALLAITLRSRERRGTAVLHRTLNPPICSQRLLLQKPRNDLRY